MHRVGRTGRAGKSGRAVTLMVREDWRHAAELIDILQKNQAVSRPQRGRATRGRELSCGAVGRELGVGAEWPVTFVVFNRNLQT